MMNPEVQSQHHRKLCVVADPFNLEAGKQEIQGHLQLNKLEADWAT